VQRILSYRADLEMLWGHRVIVMHIVEMNGVTQVAFHDVPDVRIRLDAVQIKISNFRLFEESKIADW